MTDRMRTGKTGRDSKGRFIKGNPGGPGRPPAASAHEHRRAMLAAVGPDVVARVMRKLAAQALEGDVAAARLLPDRVLGRVMDAELQERLERLEDMLMNGGDGGNGKPETN